MDSSDEDQPKPKKIKKPVLLDLLDSDDDENESKSIFEKENAH